MSYKHRASKLIYTAKSDVVSEILLGSRPINNMAETFQDARYGHLFKPSFLKKRLEKVIAESSCEKTRKRAQQAIEGLKLFKEMPIPETKRQLILKNIDQPEPERLKKQGAR